MIIPAQPQRIDLIYRGFTKKTGADPGLNLPPALPPCRDDRDPEFLLKLTPGLSRLLSLYRENCKICEYRLAL